jgi:hypothetical protein
MRDVTTSASLLSNYTYVELRSTLEIAVSGELILQHDEEFCDLYSLPGISGVI